MRCPCPRDLSLSALACGRIFSTLDRSAEQGGRAPAIPIPHGTEQSVPFLFSRACDMLFPELGGSSNGRTSAFGAEYVGSNPAPPPPPQPPSQQKILLKKYGK